MRLALALGRTLRELEASLTLAEARMWQEFMRTEPIGEERADWRAAMTTAILFNAHAARGQPMKSAADFVFMPEMRRGPPEDHETLADIARAWGAIP